MRRQTIDFSYKNRTASIVDDSFDPWQLTKKDPREGVHRLVNEIVSSIQEMDTEADYIERMFFPEKMDLSEPWVMFSSYPEHPLEELYISGELSTDLVDVVVTIDDFLAGGIDYLNREFIISGVPWAESIRANDIDHLYMLGSGYITEYNLQNQSFTKSGQVDITSTTLNNFYADIEHPVYSIREDFREETVAVTISGRPVPYTMELASDMTGVWVDEYDINLDGYIGDYERSRIESSMGVSQQEVSPSVWALYDWMDVNKDGTISQSDYNAIMTSVTSAAPDVTAIIKVPRSVVGAVTVAYDRMLPRSKHLYRWGDRYERLSDLDKLYGFASKLAYDIHTGVYFGINSDGTELRAYKYDRTNNEVVSDLLVHVERWSKDCLLIDLDTADGFLYVLVSDNTTTKLFYGDIWKEAVYDLPDSAIISSLNNQTPTAMTTTMDGYFAIMVGDTIQVFSQGIDKAMSINGIGYFGRRYPLTLKDSTPLKTIPSYIFNSFDSFAYSAMGIERPLGCDNLQMRKLIMDFWKHSQGNDKIGMNFGMMREFGYENEDTIVSGTVYHLPAELTYSGTPPEEEWNLYINGYPMDVTPIVSGESYLLSGEPGTLFLIGGTEIIPEESVTTLYNSLRIEGYFIDGNDDIDRYIYTIPIASGKTTPDIMVRTYGDPAFLEDVGYTVSGEPVQALIDIVFEAESTNPFVYNNIITNRTPMDSNRISQEPILETVYDVDMSGLISGLIEVELEL